MEFKIAPVLSSRGFYNMVNILSETLIPDEQYILDMTELTEIEALAIPNLLLLGQFIEKRTGHIPQIRLGEDLSSGFLKNYLNQINFFTLSESYYSYENPEARYGGLIGKKMDVKNRTERFWISQGIEIAQRRLYYSVFPFLGEYLFKFYAEIAGEDLSNNILAHFLREIIENSFEYGQDDVIVTVQANYKKDKIYMSASDAGRGFCASMQERMDNNGRFMKKVLGEDGKPQLVFDEKAYNILGQKPKNELEAILAGLYKRHTSETYGLYNVIKRILGYGGKIRIHSNNVQLILSDKWKDSFEEKTLLADMQRFAKYNIVRTQEFPGTHIEIELPMTIADKGGRSNVRY